MLQVFGMLHKPWVDTPTGVRASTEIIVGSNTPLVGPVVNDLLIQVSEAQPQAAAAAAAATHCWLCSAQQRCRASECLHWALAPHAHSH